MEDLGGIHTQIISATSCFSMLPYRVVIVDGHLQNSRIN